MRINCKTFLGEEFNAQIELRCPSDVVAFYSVVLEEHYQELLNAIEPSDTVIDAGANIGAFTVLASKAVGPDGLVVAIEPNRRNFDLLHYNMKINSLKNVKLLNKALYGESNLKLKMEGEGISAKLSPAGSYSVDTISLDLLAQEFAIRPRHLKLDIEGAECEAISGMLNCTSYLNDISAEVHSEENMHRFINFLEAHGFAFNENPAYMLNSALRKATRHPLLTLRLEIANHFETTVRAIKQKIIGIERVLVEKDLSPTPHRIIFAHRISNASSNCSNP